jgi:2-oxoglutarate/2-oxoacid ferredoxin oxidoreductase subunit alpha
MTTTDPSVVASTAGSSTPFVKSVVELDRVVIRLAGDSGDGMQLTGNRFTSETASFGNDLSTLPNFPAEIRAPTGTLPGVSSFQLHFADHDIMTPGDAPDVLVAMNPAALKANLSDLPGGGLLIVDADEFTPRNLAKVGYATNPLEDGSLDGWQLVSVPLTTLTLEALADSGLGKKEAERSKNMFTLGLLSWMYHRPTEGTVRFLERQFRRKPQIAAANIAAFRAGYNYGDTTEAFAVSYEIKPAPMAPGRYRNISGNQALALGIVAAGQRSGLPVFLGAYPITPASDILHELSRHKSFGVRTFQAEDEIAGIASAIGASFGGALGVTTTSGPGISLKSEALGLAVMTELPLVVVDVQRGGPSTGLPTKTEQSDLLQAMFGRNGEAPVPVIAPRSPADCFDAALEAARIALTYRTPVMLLSDGYLANGAEPWQIPDVEELPDLSVEFATEPNGTTADGTPEFLPYLRDPETLARPWAIPGTSGMQHRIGGLEKADKTGNISYDPANHDLMTRLRQAKVDGIAASIPPTDVDDPAGPDGEEARVAVIGWGSTYGPIGAACRRIRRSGRSVAQIHLRHLNPFPADLGEVLRRYDRVICPEMNLGQLSMLLRAKYLVDVESHTQVRGLPFRAAELAAVVQDVIDSTTGGTP